MTTIFPSYPGITANPSVPRPFCLSAVGTPRTPAISFPAGSTG